MRTLASIQEVSEITAIDGADAVEAARIQGWVCVVRKGEFAVGDRGVYFEIDSVLPDEPEYRFLWSVGGVTPGPGERPPKFRIGTKTLRGCRSQGLLMSIPAGSPLEGREAGCDVTAELGVTKYEVELPDGMAEARAPFPSQLPQTVEARAQSKPALIAELTGQPYVITQKCDGYSSTFLISPDDQTLHVCGRQWSLKEDTHPFWPVAARYELDRVLREAGGRYAVQGEICGPGVLRNKLGLPELSLFVFNVFDLEERRYLDDSEMRDVCATLGLTPVPVIESGGSFEHSLESLLTLAEGTYPGTKNRREGIVVRPQRESLSRSAGGRLSFKVVAIDFLLKSKD